MNTIQILIGVAVLAAPIIIGAWMLVIGLKGIGRMLGFTPPEEVRFFCAMRWRTERGIESCWHEIQHHPGPYGADPCQKRGCRCPHYVSALMVEQHPDWDWSEIAGR